jgi:uncharacterized short protein YbdD (DUF466 family)
MRLRALPRFVRWYLRELTGEAEYDHYCAHLLADHPHVGLPSRREYQRLRALRQRETPCARCC